MNKQPPGIHAALQAGIALTQGMRSSIRAVVVHPCLRIGLPPRTMITAHTEFSRVKTVRHSGGCGRGVFDLRTIDSNPPVNRLDWQYKQVLGIWLKNYRLAGLRGPSSLRPPGPKLFK